MGVVGHVHRIRFKFIELRQGLGVQILPIHQEKDFFDSFFLGKDLASLEGCQCLSATCRMPNIAIVFCLQCLSYKRFDCVNLIRTHHHKDFICLVQHHVASNHFCQMTFLHKTFREFAEHIDAIVFHVGPVEHLALQDYSITIGEITRFLTVADHKNLDVAEQTGVGLLAIAHDLIERLRHIHSASFQFYLHERQPVNQERNIIAVGVLSLHADLVGDLERVFTPFFRVEQLQIKILAVIAFEQHLVSQNFGAVENTLAVDLCHKTIEFFIGKGVIPNIGSVSYFQNAAEVRNHRCFTIHFRYPLVAF